MNQEIKPNGVYTTSETQDILRISESTIKRLLKKGLLRANKVGGQYRILGKEILRLLSPEIEKEAVKSYLAVKTGKPEELYDMVHTENFVLVDRKRRVRGFYDGTKKEEVERLLADINFLSEEEK